MQHNPHTSKCHDSYALLFLAVISLLFGSCNKEALSPETSKIQPIKDNGPAPSSPNTGQIRGQVFIATEGGQSIKLALTDIMLYKQSDIESASVKYRKMLEERYAVLKKREQDVQARTKSIAQEIDALKQAYAGQEGSSELTSKITEIRIRAAALQVERARVEEDAVRDNSLFFQHLTFPFTKTTTDADGKFEVSLPKSGRFALAATNTRRVGQETEKYFWLIWVSLDDKNSKTLMLSNRNLITGTDPDNVLQ